MKHLWLVAIILMLFGTGCISEDDVRRIAREVGRPAYRDRKDHPAPQTRSDSGCRDAQRRLRPEQPEAGHSV